MRGFEKISFKQFSKDIKDDKKLYENYKLPSRNSKKAAGYDFYLIEDIEMKPGEIVKIPTGVKSYFEDDEVLMIFVRSSTGFKYNIRMVNQVGIIDADYYNNKDNEGHMYIKLQNEGDKTVSFKKGDHLAQGIFMKYLTTDDDEGNDKERRTSY